MDNIDNGSRAIDNGNGGSSSLVLIVDDDDSLRTGMVRLVTAEGYRAIEAKNGREAIEIVGQTPPDIILLDWMMPEMSGIEVCRTLKGNEKTRLIPIVMITALHEQEEKIKAIDAGVDDFLNKPINIPELRARVRSLLRMKRLNDLLDSADTVISALANAIEAKDKYTEGHNDRVSRYALALAKAAGVSPEEQNIVLMGGILHDVGKIGVPDRILNKNGPLDKNEFEHIRAHPDRGSTILDPLRSLIGIRDVVLYHHERYDGKGYPFGLKGDGIPLYARIIAIADSYDAMTSKRPYRDALSQEVAIQELENNAGAMWDPELVSLFIGILQNKEAAGERLQ